MRVITVKDPWAYAIASLGKDVENRSRNIAGSYRGDVAIHSAARELPIGPYFEAARAIAKITGVLPLATLPEGKAAIIAVVELVDVHHADWCWDDGNHCTPWAMADHFHMKLANPRPLSKPIPFRGALGLRELDGATTDLIQEALA